MNQPRTPPNPDYVVATKPSTMPDGTIKAEPVYASDFYADPNKHAGWWWNDFKRWLVGL